MSKRSAISVASLYKVSVTHCFAINLGSITDTYTANNILSVYAKCRELGVDLKVFDEIPHRDTVTWNSMTAGYENCGNLESAWGVLNSMRRSHSLIVKTRYGGDVYSASALLDMYAKCERVEDAYKVFRGMPERNFVSWNAMIAGLQKWVIADFFFIIRLYRAGRPCSDLATLQLGQQVHALALKSGFEANDFVASSLIFMYSKCGIIEDARKSFEVAPKNTSIIFGMEHYACGIDLFGCAGRPELAKALIAFEPDAMLWKTLLGACRTCGDIELATQVVSCLLELEP
ncbi:pentatricopeptide repeat (PPR) superfamily protein [Actinidia rufa]|uniref:Pentatricopeptide repeat (PPR) superfamily protein n=1 Tax=Actinidia rufa TaxID=165716 RepID=A0A7J0GBU8_9ERIC|nr:pentatricopeptide repeat (PPR) superfamily protein [Actinidia rufa]